MIYTRGYIAITAVIILSALFLSISIGVASRAISASQVSIAYADRDAAQMRAEACVEYALMELVRTLHYEGDDSILIGEGSCDILPILGEENTNRTIRTEGTSGEYTYRIRMVVDSVSPEVIVASFDRVADF